MSEPTFADKKAELAQLGVSLPPDARMAALVETPEGPGPIPVTILERVQQGRTPGYCIHGYTNCIGCDHPCYLGHATFAIVANFQAYPLCRECGAEWVPPGTPIAGIFAEHPRTDGPH